MRRDVIKDANYYDKDMRIMQKGAKPEATNF